MENQSSEERFMDGNYRMIRRLGSGGDGIVYLVEHVPTEQLRAAKRIEGSRAGERVNELNMMKHLHHPSLPQIIDILECAGQTWLVMEYIRGVALSESDYRTVTAEQFFGSHCSWLRQSDICIPVRYQSSIWISSRRMC